LKYCKIYRGGGSWSYPLYMAWGRAGSTGEVGYRIAG
jgi:hypothetical protein